MEKFPKKYKGIPLGVLKEIFAGIILENPTKILFGKENPDFFIHSKRKKQTQFLTLALEVNV